MPSRPGSADEKTRQSLSRWSKDDPVITCSGDSGHWTQLKVRALSAHPTHRHHQGILGGEPVSQAVELTSLEEAKLRARAMQTQRRPNGIGRVDPVANSICDRVPLRDFHGCGPENYTRMWPRPKTSPGKRNTLRTSYNLAARSGYKYWYQDRPKPTSFGRYGIGSYKTVLGLGNGPRT